MIKSFQDLIVWQKSMDLVELVYKYVDQFPDEERFALNVQIRRSVVSVPSNIAEGHGRRGNNEYSHHLSIAHGSLMECLTQTLIAKRLGYWNENTTNSLVNLIEKISKMLKTLIYRLKR